MRFFCALLLNSRDWTAEGERSHFDCTILRVFDLFFWWVVLRGLLWMFPFFFVDVRFTCCARHFSFQFLHFLLDYIKSMRGQWQLCPVCLTLLRPLDPVVNGLFYYVLNGSYFHIQQESTERSSPGNLWLRSYKTVCMIQREGASVIIKVSQIS